MFSTSSAGHAARLRRVAVSMLMCAGGCASTDPGLSTGSSSAEAEAEADTQVESEAEVETGSSGTGESGDPLTELSDEFDEPGQPQGWMLRHLVEDTPAQYERLEVTNGGLELEPTTSGWFGDYDAPFLFKLIEGEFVLEVEVDADDRDELGTAPEELFNSAGLLVRNPSHGPGTENWVMHNVGLQSGNVATEGKTTVDSLSVLTLAPGARRGRLRICRIGQEIELARWLEDEDAWNITHTFPRADFPETLQVGLIVNGWNSSGIDPDLTRTPDLLARFEYARFWTPETFEACDQPAPGG